MKELSKITENASRKPRHARQALSAKAATAQTRAIRHFSVQKIQTAAALLPAHPPAFRQVSATDVHTLPTVRVQALMKRLHALKPALQVTA